MSVPLNPVPSPAPPPGSTPPPSASGPPQDAPTPTGTLLQHLVGRTAIAAVWLLHWLPLGLQDFIGRGLGGLLWHLGRSRRHVALRNLSLCMPRLNAIERESMAREHFALIGRSLLERGLLWFAPAERLKRLIQVRGDIELATRSDRPVMWILPHFVGLEWVAPALTLFQTQPVVDIYQPQSNPVLDAQVIRGRLRFGKVSLISRADGIRPVMRLIRDGCGFVNAPDMDFGPKDSTFVSFFGVPTCTLLAPAKMARSLNMIVQPIVVTLLPGGDGIDVHFGDPLPNYPTDDPVADAQTFNHWLEDQIWQQPAQYFWVHRRFKTRPPGTTPLY